MVAKAVVLAATSEYEIEKSDRACYAAAQGLNGPLWFALGHPPFDHSSWKEHEIGIGAPRIWGKN